MKSKKETITQAEIKKDIINGLKQPREIPIKKSHKKWIMLISAIGLLLAVLQLTYPFVVLYFGIFLFVLFLTLEVVDYFRCQHKIKDIHMDNYDVITEVLSDTLQEECYAPRGTTKKVYTYTLRFENGQSWRVPKDNYPWSKERPMSDFAFYQSSHRGDVFIIVVKKDTGKIAAAYNTEFFEYKN